MELREYLTNLGLSEMILFRDIPGLAAANAAHKQLPHTGALLPGQYRDRGNRAYQAGRFDDALTEYESYAATLPDGRNQIASKEMHSLRWDDSRKRNWRTQKR